MAFALSIRQPWASCIVSGFKPVENRSWRTSFRGEFYIHASRRFDHEGLEWLITQGMIPAAGNCASSYLTGGIVGKAMLVDCVTEFDSPWFFGPVGFVLEAAKEIPFIQMPGRLGLFSFELPATGDKGDI